MPKTPATTAEPSFKGRIRPALSVAIKAIVHEGLTITDAAKRAGLQRESLSKALIKPHVVAYRSAVKRAWLDNETGKAWVRVAQLCNEATSEDVRLKAAKLILEAAGELERDDRDSGGARRPAVQIVVNYPPESVTTRAGLPGVIELAPINVRLADSNGVIQRP